MTKLETEQNDRLKAEMLKALEKLVALHELDKPQLVRSYIEKCLPELIRRASRAS